MGLEPMTSSLPRKCSTTELYGPCLLHGDGRASSIPTGGVTGRGALRISVFLFAVGSGLERVMGIEPTSSAWKAEVLPLNYTRLLWLDEPVRSVAACLVEGVGFEPTKAEPADLQSAPVDRLGTPPKR